MVINYAKLQEVLSFLGELLYDAVWFTHIKTLIFLVQISMTEIIILFPSETVFRKPEHYSQERSTDIDEWRITYSLIFYHHKGITIYWENVSNAYELSFVSDTCTIVSTQSFYLSWEISCIIRVGWVN